MQYYLLFIIFVPINYLILIYFMANPWLNFPDNVPDDQEEVWVRVKYFSYNTFKCIWDSTAQTFTTSNTEIVYPAWTISKFKRII